MNTDTIAAIATGVGSGGISIIRISGNNALPVIDKIYKSKKNNKLISEQKSHTIHYGFIVDGEEVVDEVMVTVMKAPLTYTREDVVEINCHGGIVVTKKILDIVLKQGVRLAEPGEFTKRAFLNGRIDLSQAEAVCDIINAKNEMALKNSLNQLRGREFDIIKELREGILRDVAYIEAALDDPENYSLDGFSEHLLNNIDSYCKKIEKLISDSKNGKLIKEGIKTVILGKPNAGKSSLLNILVKEERAIVTDIAGTTRDTLEETVQLNEITLNIIDTAGIRKTEDVVEKIGVEKAIRIAKEADLIIYVIDSTTPLDENDEAILSLIRDKKAILLFNKSDLPPKININELKEKTDHPVIITSFINYKGLDELEKLIKEMFFKGELKLNEDILITNDRHIEAFRKALEALSMVKDSIENQMPEDFYSIDLMTAYEVLGKIIGENVEEDLINLIFSEFCMGK
ncbi:tRNA modification GTPase [Herbinix hemicellulosilytica]|uniref:tRNA modification GTPase MnmE n=1 Tax=Herbinix hemicellulosilytica TaxID=1564487 RepID=A0A0H5SJL0_HERHM|nr:tRNA uridine-5-carboxymethylaminomethyl(34) synthesis GTPase MnmE [Herbinix hemicellulosilytica]RBP57356.1 tRNA modification GTPase [Herbinix hemicellulosilytica]CRZ35697.1 tRNA modification GTPase MnmE [Herbinix hemicellulosilytica]